MTPELILVGRVLTGDRGRARAGAVAFAAGRVHAVGEEPEIVRLRGARTEILGGREATVVPGFVDAHLHLLALARRRVEVNCSADRCPSLRELLDALSAAAAGLPAGRWILAFGYDEALLAERRSPRLAELDAAAPAHPVRLLHRTGLAAVLNAAAIRALDLGPIPELERDGRGDPTGLLRDAGEVLRGRIPRLERSEEARLCREASRELLALGITTIHDPTPGRDAAEVAEMRGLVESGAIRQRLRLYVDPGAARAAESAGDRFRCGGMKIVLTEGSDPETFARDLECGDRRGLSVAIHAVEEGPLAVAIEGLSRLGAERVRRRRHRIEHASLCPPPLASAIAGCGATVVTHPAFLPRFWEKYREAIEPGQWSWLYPLRTFLDAGVPVAFGSDGPIASPSPLATIASAVERRVDDRRRLRDGQEISVAEALSLHTEGGAWASGEEESLGRLVPGAHADAVLLAADPTAVPLEEIASIPVRATIAAGEVAWRA